MTIATTTNREQYATDGVTTEVSGSDLKEDLDVVIGETLVQDAGGDTTNPFMIKIPSHGSRKL